MVDARANEEDRKGSDDTRPPTASSPADLLEHLIRMTDSLERTWSAALDTDSAAEARRDLRVTWMSFTVQLTKHYEWVDRHSQRLGLGVLSGRFPLDDEGLSDLVLDPPGPIQRYRQLRIAVLYAVHAFGVALNALDRPTGAEVAFPSGTVAATWWEAGAFGLLRRRAHALARILRSQERCLQELVEGQEEVPDLPNPSLAAPLPWVDALTIAADLVRQGYCEAALPPLLRSLRLVLSNAAGIDADRLPVPLAPVLRSIAGMEALAQHADLLETAAERMGRGATMDLGVAVPLAHGMLDRVNTLARARLPRQLVDLLRTVPDAS